MPSHLAKQRSVRELRFCPALPCFVPPLSAYTQIVAQVAALLHSHQQVVKLPSGLPTGMRKFWHDNFNADSAPMSSFWMKVRPSLVQSHPSRPYVLR